MKKFEKQKSEVPLESLVNRLIIRAMPFPTFYYSSTLSVSSVVPQSTRDEIQAIHSPLTEILQDQPKTY